MVTGVVPSEYVMLHGAVPVKVTDKVDDSPAQISESPDKAMFPVGNGCTVTGDVVELHLVEVSCSVKVKVTVPAATPVTTPVAALMVATAGLLLTQVPVLLAVQVMFCPVQTSEGPDRIGSGFTVNFRTWELVCVQVGKITCNL